MSIHQLFHLQCLEQEIADEEHNLAGKQASMGTSPELRQARTNLSLAQAGLEALRKEQKDAEYAIADLSSKMTVAHESLYSGRIKNPKELQNLQHEYDNLKAQRDPLEEKVLLLMEQIDASGSEIARLDIVLSGVEAAWKEDQKVLQAEIAAIKQALAELEAQKDTALPAIAREELSLYQQVKQMRGQAIARVEQGACTMCRISLSSAEAQRVRTGAMVYCSSCGRLLFLE